MCPQEPETNIDASEAESEEYDTKRYGTNKTISLFTSLRVYVMADKFDVPGLKLLVRDRFYHSAAAYFETFDQFPDVVDELYETSPPYDQLMRDIPYRLIAAAWNRPIMDKMVPVMLMHPDSAVGVLKAAYRGLGLEHMLCSRRL
ncbi:hypothetical protein TOPH_06483 [Tolypocladium ophioglossoides CBS 100239]|uniref:Uncharacterized protein n=1 Tax=Tolypocladium ophioglossoides (strain CBS 100239) TaxID=1163406 RepID=A0A0L0N490_TOLOC|nr:hypothetical protein TOPH_06483 [Tolypocladium ophioglossoides CBS 100239]